jgi:hypothetical protein
MSRVRYQAWGAGGVHSGYVYRSFRCTVERSVASALAYRFARGRVLDFAPDGWSLGRPRYRVQLGTPGGRSHGWVHFVVLP